jgi:hypothetical protein
MESDDRELRLRANFGFTMVWAALTIGVFGYLRGIVLSSVAAATGPLFGFALGESGRTALQAAGHILVGTAVTAGLIQS